MEVSSSTSSSHRPLPESFNDEEERRKELQLRKQREEQKDFVDLKKRLASDKDHVEAMRRQGELQLQLQV
jgi:hypothetical protein